MDGALTAPGGRPSRRAAAALVVAAGIVASVAGCVIVPYRPPAESDSTPVRLENAEHVVLTIGPRELLEDTRAELRRRDRDFVLADGLAFRDAVFPDGDWRLSSLLDPARRALLEGSGADYLVVASPVRMEAGETHGLFLETGLGYYGAASATEQGSALVLIVDLGRGEVLDALRTRAEGTHVAVGWFYGLILYATTESSVRGACLDAVVETIRAARPTGAVTLAVMAAEPVDSAEVPLAVITE